MGALLFEDFIILKIFDHFEDFWRFHQEDEWNEDIV